MGSHTPRLQLNMLTFLDIPGVLSCHYNIITWELSIHELYNKRCLEEHMVTWSQVDSTNYSCECTQDALRSNHSGYIGGYSCHCTSSHSKAVNRHISGHTLVSIQRIVTCKLLPCEWESLLIQNIRSVLFLSLTASDGFTCISKNLTRCLSYLYGDFWQMSSAFKIRLQHQTQFLEVFKCNVCAKYQSTSDSLSVNLSWTCKKKKNSPIFLYQTCCIIQFQICIGNWAYWPWVHL